MATGDTIVLSAVHTAHPSTRIAPHSRGTQPALTLPDIRSDRRTSARSGNLGETAQGARFPRGPHRAGTMRPHPRGATKLSGATAYPAALSGCHYRRPHGRHGADSDTITLQPRNRPRQAAHLREGEPVKLLWTRDPKPTTSRPVSQVAPDADEEPDPRHPPVGRTPKVFLTVPFDLATCTLLQGAGEAEQSAFSAHLRAHPTRAAFWEHAPAADWMLEVLRRGWHVVPIAPDSALRAFALQCVADLQGTDAPGLAELKSAVERRVTGSFTSRELEAVQAKTQPLVTPGGVQGLPRCSRHAAGQLALWHTANPNPYEAAFWAAEFAALHDAFVTLGQAAQSWTPPAGTPAGWHVGFYAHHHPDVRARAIRKAHERLAVMLKARLPQPFAEVTAPGRLS